MQNKAQQENIKNFIFDISPGSVSGAIVSFSEQRKKSIIDYSVKERIIISETLSAETLRKKTLEALERVCSSLSRYDEISGLSFSIGQAYVFLSSPWIDFKNTNLFKEEITPFVLTEERLQKILAQQPSSEALINRQIVSLFANEYNVPLSFATNKEIQKLEINILDVYMPEKDKALFLELISNYFTFTDIIFHSFLPVLFNLVSKIYDPSDDFIFVDANSEMIDFGIFREGKIENISSIPLGKNTILREMVLRSLSPDLKTAEAIFSFYKEGKIEKGLKDKISEIVKEKREIFSGLVRETLLSYELYNVPTQTFVLSSSDENFLLREFDMFGKLIILDQRLLKNFTDISEGLLFDNFLAAEADFVYS